MSGLRAARRTVAAVDLGAGSGRVVLVTGAASGIGLATGRALHAQGADVVVADLDLAVRVDVTDPVEVASALDAAVLALGEVDLVVNNAGFVRLGTLLVV